MKRYKLIKRYPGSPPLNTVVEWCDRRQAYKDISRETSYNIYSIYSYPEFWEEVKEKDYEILSFKDKRSCIIIHKDKYDNYDHESILIGYWKEHDILENLNFEIYSVKRLSDGEVFTIGDIINSKGWSKSSRNDIITSIFISDKQYSERFPNLAENSIVLQTAITWQTPLNKSIKIVIKKPLFTTEDEVDIFEGDSYWHIFSDFSLTEIKTKVTNPTGICTCTFSTKEKAEEYIIMNKPYLSLKELQEHFYLIGLDGEDIYKSKINNSLYNKVKSKLNIK